jgi:hypothetical protein
VHDTAAWRETSTAALRTDAAKPLAQAITATEPKWWSVFAASYRKLRASAQGRARNLHSRLTSNGQAWGSSRLPFVSRS